MSQALAFTDSLPTTDLPSSADKLARDIAEIDRQLRRAGLTVPPDEAKQELASRFWAFMQQAQQIHAQGGAGDPIPERCREILSPWLYRSRYWNRSYHKPHGYAGDFMMIEWIYDLERDRCEDPTLPGIVNCLDYLYWTVAAVQAVWERRHWLSRLIRREHERLGGKLRILDVACGGARYIRDFLLAANDLSGVEITLVDQDAAALAFCRTRSLTPWLDRVEFHATSVVKVGSHLRDREFDLVISAGLFDYLNEPVARHVMGQLASLLAPGGLLAISNFHTADTSRLVKDWLIDWRLIYRQDAQVAALLPESLEVTTTLSKNEAICYATGRARS